MCSLPTTPHTKSKYIYIAFLDTVFVLKDILIFIYLSIYSYIYVYLLIYLSSADLQCGAGYSVFAPMTSFYSSIFLYIYPSIYLSSADLQCSAGYSVCAPRHLSWSCGNNHLMKGKA